MICVKNIELIEKDNNAPQPALRIQESQRTFLKYWQLTLRKQHPDRSN